MKVSTIEQIKFRAAFYNGFAITLFAVGGLGSLFFFNRIANNPLWGFSVFVAALAISIVIHLIGHAHIRKLDDNE